jgi:hypothetical protein
VIRQDGATVGEHRRRFGRGKTIYDPWHYVPVLARKPRALRNGAPFKDWLLPASLERGRRKQKGSNDGDRQMVKWPLLSGDYRLKTHDGVRRLPVVDLVDPLRGEIGESYKVLGSAQPLGLEPAHPSGRSCTPGDRPIADHAAHRRVAAQSLGVVHVFIADQPPEYRLTQLSR